MENLHFDYKRLEQSARLVDTSWNSEDTSFPFAVSDPVPNVIPFESRRHVLLSPSLHNTPFPEIIGVDRSMYYLNIFEFCRIIEDILHPPNQIKKLYLKTAVHFFLLDLLPDGYHVLVGICSDTKAFPRHIVPLGEKLQDFDSVQGINIDDPPDRLMYYFMSRWRPAALGAIFRGITEEVTSLSDEDRVFFRTFLRTSSYIDFAFLDGRTGFLNIPVIAKYPGDDILRPILTEATRKEWISPLMWVPLRALCQESFEGHPIPNGVRYVAMELMKN